MPVNDTHPEYDQALPDGLPKACHEMDAPSFENAVAERDGCERVMCWRAKMRLSLP